MPQKEDNLGKKCPNLYVISTRDETVSSLFAAKHKTRPEMVKQILGRLIQLTDQFTKALDRAVVTSRDHSFIPHQLKSKSKELAGLLRQLSCSNLGTYDRPARAIINQIEVTLDRCLFRLLKHPKCIIIKIIKKRFSTFIPVTCFLEISAHLDASIGDVSWLISFWRAGPPDEDFRRPPVTLNQRILWLVWEEIAILHHPATTFGSRETRMINRLVQLLNGSEFDVAEEACIALTKFACTDKYFNVDHSKAIISAGGVKHLIQILYDKKAEYALVLICYIALHVPDSEELAQAEVLAALTWASKLSYMTKYEEVDKLLCNIPVRVPEMEEFAQAGVLPMLEWETEQSYMSKDETVLTLLQGAKSRLNLHQSKASRGVH